MSLLQILIVAVVQGVTEFLPISSQAHLILLPRATGWCDQGAIVDIGVHFGTLLAVMAYFWRDCLGLARGAASLTTGRLTPQGQMFVHVAIASIPVFAAGFALWFITGTGGLRNMALIGWTTIIFGVVLWIADQSSLRIRTVEHMTVGSALIIGCAQVLALIPGTSRAGITMAAARALGFKRTEAARFSLLMAIPAILGASAMGGIELIRAGNPLFTTQVAVAAVAAFVVALLAIAAMMHWLRRAGFLPFVVYRILLGLVLLTLVYGFGVADALPSATGTACGG